MRANTAYFSATNSIADPARLAEAASPEVLEYIALKQEQQTRLILRDTALYVTIGAILTSASILNAASSTSASQLIQFGSLAAPAFSLAMFLIYFRNDYYLSLARRYIVRELGPRIEKISALGDGSALNNLRASSSFRWEKYHRRPIIVWLAMRLISMLVMSAVFLGPVIVCFWLAENTPGAGFTELAKVVGSSASAIIALGIIRLTFL